MFTKTQNEDSMLILRRNGIDVVRLLNHHFGHGSAGTEDDIRQIINAYNKHL